MSTEHIAVIDHRVTALEDDRNEMLQVLKELNVAVNKLVIIDERQVQAAIIMDRLTKSADRAHERIDVVSGEMGSRIDGVRSEVQGVVSALGKSVSALKSEAHDAHVKIEARIDELEKAEVENKRVRGWVFAIIGLLGLAVAGAILKLIGLSV